MAWLVYMVSVAAHQVGTSCICMVALLMPEGCCHMRFVNPLDDLTRGPLMCHHAA